MTTKERADQAAQFLRDHREQFLACLKGQYTRLIDQYDPPGPNGAYVAVLDHLDDMLAEAAISAIDNVGELAAQTGGA